MALLLFFYTSLFLFPPFFSLIFGNSARYRSYLTELPNLFMRQTHDASAETMPLCTKSDPNIPKERLHLNARCDML